MKNEKNERLYQYMAQAYIAKQRAEAEEEIESLPEPEYSDVFCDSMDRIVKELNQKEQPAKKHTRIKKRLVMLVAAAMVFTVLAISTWALKAKFAVAYTTSASTHTDITFRDNLQTPEGWDYIYWLTNLPENYQLIDTIESKDNLTQIYANPAQPNLPQILFMQYKNAPDALSLNTEKAERHSVTIGESNAEHIFDGEQNLFVWQADDLYFVLSTSLSYDTALAAANSFTR